MGGGVISWTMEHINIIIIYSQEVSISKSLYNGYWFKYRPVGVNITIVDGSIGIYRPRVFRVRSGPNQ